MEHYRLKADHDIIAIKTNTLFDGDIIEYDRYIVTDGNLVLDMDGVLLPKPLFNQIYKKNSI